MKNLCKELKKIFFCFFILFTFNTISQTSTDITVNPNDSRVITTGVPFLLIASDARAASLGDMGVATSVDNFSQYWNPSKYVFSESKSGFGLSYTPYLSKLVNDISLGNLAIPVGMLIFLNFFGNILPPSSLLPK